MNAQLRVAASIGPVPVDLSVQIDHAHEARLKAVPEIVFARGPVVDWRGKHSGVGNVVRREELKASCEVVVVEVILVIAYTGHPWDARHNGTHVVHVGIAVAPAVRLEVIPNIFFWAWDTQR